MNDLKNRLAQFALSLHPEKTRLIEFGAFAAERRKRRGESKPETSDFLGYTHLCGTRKEPARAPDAAQAHAGRAQRDRGNTTAGAGPTNKGSG
jgi:hypothetical protein